MIFHIPRLIEHISSIMTLEVSPAFLVRLPSFPLGFHTYFHDSYPLCFSALEIIIFYLYLVFLFFSLYRFKKKLTKTQPGRRLDSHRNAIRRRPCCPRWSSGMPLGWRERQGTDETGVFCGTKGRWLSLPAWGMRNRSFISMELGIY